MTEKPSLLTKPNFLIVGQGIAGTMVGHFLEKRGLTFQVIDCGDNRGATHVAAGLINPITGRKFVKSWHIDQLLPEAKSVYQELQKKFGIPLLKETTVVRALENVEAENDWLNRCGDPMYKPYILDHVPMNDYHDVIHRARAYGGVGQALQIDLKSLVDHYRAYWESKGYFHSECFDFNAITFSGEKVVYKDRTFHGVIFCEGAQVKQNPFFNSLPFHGDKGEVLIVSVPGVHLPFRLKQKLFLLPLYDDIYWVGATYERHFKEIEPSKKGQDYLLTHLKALLKVPFEVVDHLAAIRPTVKDRRPFLGEHPYFKGLYLFNGMGTKGTSLAPFWAKAFVAYLVDGAKLDAAVDIARYYNYIETSQP